MINLFKLVNLYFNIKIDIEIKNLLNEDLFLKPEDLAIHIYRLQNKIIEKYGENNSSTILQVLSYIQRMYTQIEIYYSAKIGKNFKITHGLGTVIGARVNLKDNIHIYQNVTLGDKDGGRPTIYDNVTIFAGAKVLGDIEIGKNSIIGANSVVIDSFPENSIIIGTPAKLKKTIKR